ncbi:probable galacturonosyltransferase 6 [Rutidosis leptorrhynchoides]|uniref:probable galacturonosyltransferase 6 n=1 Tax=Rutidosis leptorrhynchoides TaxID=125765 RepID=UPI003A99B666
MKQFRRRTRICILSLLFLSVFAPILLLYETKGFIEDLSSLKSRRDLLKLNVLKQEESEGLREPVLNVYKDVNADSFGSLDIGVRTDDSGSDENIESTKVNGDDIDVKLNNGQSQEEEKLLTSGRKGDVGRATLGHDQEQGRRSLDMKIKEMKDQLIRAKAYLNFAIPANNAHLIKELRLRIKELERAMGEVSKDSDLSRRALQRMKAMEVSLSKAARIYPDCSSMVKKLRAMTHNAEELVRVQKQQEAFLVQLAGRTTPKGLHCLSMRLTAEYFNLKSEKRQLPKNPDVHELNLYHFVVFSDNVLACAVVVDSTISSVKDPAKIVIHVVTDSLNFAAISMWFLLRPPKKGSVKIYNMDKFDWFSTKYELPNIEGHDSQDPRYTSTLNHLRFYLPDIFPTLNKVVLLDHDVVVQRDLTQLWRVNMMGKVNGAVKTCQGHDPAFRRVDLLVNLSNPMVAKRFDNETCTWAFGVNVFDLREWRRKNLTNVYNKYLQLGKKKPMWKAGSLPLGWLTFYNQTAGLDHKWHVHGLGYHSGIRQDDIEQAAVIHYDGVMKPWLNIGIEKYKIYWRKHVDYSHPYLQQCNIA